MPQITADPERLLDLVRYMRAELHDEGLITDEEYATLASVGAGSARRLEGYDALRAENARLRDALGVMRDRVDEAMGHFARSGVRPPLLAVCALAEGLETATLSAPGSQDDA